MVDKALEGYIKSFEKQIKDIEDTKKMLIAMNNKKPIANLKDQIKAFNDGITALDASLAKAKKIMKEGY